MKPYFLYFLVLLVLFLGCSNNEKTKTTETIVKEKPVSGEISYNVDTTLMKGYIAYPEDIDSPKPGILVVHEWWGHNEYARKRADMLADLGYVALAVDMYGDGKTADHPKDAQKFAMSVMGNFETAKKRFEEALKVLKSNENVDANKIGAIGYCFGGSVVLSMVNAGVNLDAVAAFHSGLQLPVKPETTGIKTKILVCNGADDPMIPEKDVTAFKNMLDKAGIDYKYISYEGAVHAFTNPKATEIGNQFDIPTAYDKKADNESWNELKQFLATSL